jgi:hypothetical protein
MYKLYSALFLLSLLPSYSRGWSLLSSSSSSSSSSLLSSSSSSTPSSSISSPGRTTTTTTTITITPTRNNDEVVVGVSRADAMNNIATKLIMIGTAGVTTGFYLVGGDVQVVHADVTNKVASTTSIRSLERMKTLFPIKVLPLVERNDFLAVYGSLREPPFDSIRKNAKTLVLGGEDLGVQANELEKQYKILISALEKIDNTASKGTRNSNKFSSLQMKEEYDTLLIALDSFLKLGIETSQIPIQQQQQQQQQLE